MGTTLTPGTAVAVVDRCLTSLFRAHRYSSVTTALAADFVVGIGLAAFLRTQVHRFFTMSTALAADFVVNNSLAAFLRIQVASTMHHALVPGPSFNVF